MSSKQTDLFGREAKPKPILIPAGIEAEARAMLEPEEWDNIAAVNQPGQGRWCGHRLWCRAVRER